MNKSYKNWPPIACIFLLMLGLILNISLPSNLLIASLIVTTLFFLVVTQKKINWKINPNTINLVCIYVAAFISSSAAVVIDEYSYVVTAKSGFVLLFIPFFILLDRFEIFRYYSARTLRPILGVLVGLFYLQFFVYAVFGVYLDFLQLLGLRDSRPELYLSIFGITDFVRCTSLFNEPGTYCSYVAVILATAFICDVVSLRKDKNLIFLSIASMILSLSGFGFVLALFLVIALWLSTLKTRAKTIVHRNKILRAVIGGIFIFFTFTLVSSYFESRLEQNGAQKSGVLFRVVLVEKFLLSDMQTKMFGRSFEQRAVKVTEFEDYETYPEDLGTWFFWLYWYGAAFLLWVAVTLIVFLRVPPAWALVILCSKVIGFSYLFVFVSLWTIKNARAR